MVPAAQEIVLTGIVVAGDRRGRELGFPTANVELEESGAVLPDDGVYAGWAECVDEGSDQRHAAAISVGSRPTYYGERGVRLVEAYLLDFDGDLYGRRLRVGIGARVRGQVRFSRSDELTAQMERDVEVVRHVMDGVA